MRVCRAPRTARGAFRAYRRLDPGDRGRIRLRGVISHRPLRRRSPGMTDTPFDFDASAELYPSRARGSRRHPVGYKRFDRAAEALRFAIEQLPAEALVGAYLEIGEERYDAREMRALYDSDNFPLPRNPPAADAGGPPAYIP